MAHKNLIVSGGGVRESFLQVISDMFGGKLILTKIKDRTVLGVLKISFPSVIQINNSNMNDDILFFPKRFTSQRLENGEKELKIILKYKAYDSVVL